MKLLYLLTLAFLTCFVLQARKPAPAAPVLQNTNLPDTLDKNGLFHSTEVLPLSLTGNIRELLSDRGEQVKSHALTLSYTTEGKEVSIPVSVRTRGHFRKMRDNCIYPPLMLQFSKTEPGVAASVFRDQKKVKLVMPCVADEFVVREWMVYRLYNLITPKSLKARLVSVQLKEERKQSRKTSFYGILLEEEQEMARRNKAVVVETKLLKPENTGKQDFMTMAVFQYLIGNTDWSVQFLQNIKLIAADINATPTAVAYDFDHAGLVNAPYAQPAEALRMTSVQERRYRGYCITDMAEFADVVSRFNALKDDIYSLYASCPLLDAKYKKATLKYFDEFYTTINDPKAMRKQFGYPCEKNGTGNVVIKGLQKD